LENAKKSPPLAITVKGYRPFCLLELPSGYRPDGSQKPIPWSKHSASNLVSFMNNSDRFNAKIVKHEYQKKSKLYYYQPKKDAFDMIRLEFNNIDDMKKISMKIENASALTKYENLREEAAPTARGGYPKMRGFWYGKEFGRMALRCWEFDTVPTTRKFFTDADVQYSSCLRSR